MLAILHILYMQCRALVCGGQCDQTCFELDSDSGIILDLLNHLSVPADDDTNRKPGHCHLEGTRHTQGALSGGELRSVLIHASLSLNGYGRVSSLGPTSPI